MAYSKEIYQGKFVPKNPSKYKGRVNDIVYRSSYELKFMNWADKNQDVLSWSSEEIVVPYKSPLDNRIHRYFVDFFVETKDKKYLVEVKPHSFTKEPKIPQRKTKKFINEVKQYGVNLAKWESAKQFANHKGWEFLIIKEKELGLSL